MTTSLPRPQAPCTESAEAACMDASTSGQERCLHHIASAVEVAKRHKTPQGPHHEPAVDGHSAARLRALAEQLLSLNRVQEAIDLLERALPLEPECALTWFLMAAALEARGCKEQAVDHYRQCTRLEPDWAEAWFQLGVLRLKLAQWDPAVDALKHAVHLRPDWPAAWLNLGSALDGAGRPRQALAAWQHTLCLDGNDARAHYNCGYLYQKTGYMDQAVAAYNRSVELSPGMIEAHLNLGTCHQILGNLETAQTCYRQVVALAPQYILGWLNLAGVMVMLERFNDAIEAYRRALAIDPGNAETHFKLAGVLSRRWRIDEAIVHCRKALEIRPEDATAKAALYELARHGCLWQLAQDLSSDLDRLTEAQLAAGAKTTEWPLLSLWRHDDPQRNLAVAASWSREEQTRHQTMQDRPRFEHQRGKQGGKIRIGYLSGDFKAHAIAHQIRGLLRRHDRSRFEIHAYATNPSDGSDYREQLIQACDRFTPIETLEGRQAAEQIYKDGIDILVDLSGYTMGARMDILSLRPAPVQISYLGFLGSSGASCVDYFITDRVVTPPGHDRYFTEKLIHMPHCYQVNDDTMAIASQPLNRSDLGLPPEAVVFCCFNQPFKIDRKTFECWLQILHQVPQSVLWLLDHNRAARQNLTRQLELAGIEPERLIFSEPIRIDLHLARLQLADLALDTFSYNGGATTANALWAGVPLLALMGNHLVSRMSASALMAVGLPELVARNPRAYCEKAIELGRDHGQRFHLKKKLAQNRLTEPLFNTRLFARHLETAYETIAARFHEGLPPISFAVPPSSLPVDENKPRHCPAMGTDIEMDMGRMAQAAEAAIQRGDLEAAADLYRRLLTEAPQSSAIHHLLGLVYGEQGLWPAARRQFERAIALDANNAAFHHDLANALYAMDELETACRAYRQALTLRPDDVDSWINLGNALYKLKDIEPARQCYQRALQWAPASAIAMNNLGKSDYDRRDIEAAMQWYDQALQIDPDYAEAHFNRAAAWLLCGDYQRGWREYEWRFKRKQAANVYPHQLSGPRWHGEPYRNARLLVHGEQGLGDVLQFARFLPQAKALGGTLLLEVQAPLIPFIETMGVADRIVPFSVHPPAANTYDLHIALQSLPLLFGTTVSNIPGKVPYLYADASKSACWRQRLAGPKRKLGLVWSCSDPCSYRESRLEYMRPLLNLPGIHWYSLQMGSAAEQLASIAENLNLTHLGDEIRDFSDTAAIIANLDLLISVDTAAVHVAGAMGKPVWVLLPFAGDWRWLLHPTTTPWYSSARLFRQSRPDDWPGVIRNVRSELETWLQPPEPKLKPAPNRRIQGGGTCALP